jgi:hypothetical protein
MEGTEATDLKTEQRSERRFDGAAGSKSQRAVGVSRSAQRALTIEPPRAAQNRSHLSVGIGVIGPGRGVDNPLHAAVGEDLHSTTRSM